ncbi:MAG: hypothetical protein IKU38_08900 [Clostridia bacterium]|nr:hypothetical protein [Clostridia bacterium]
MVKCEKRDYGYEIQVSGTANDVIGEIANLAAVFHVNVMKDDLHVDMKKDRSAAIKASCCAFGAVMKKAMEDILDEAKTQNIVLKGDAAKGGVVQ